jgi:cobalt/nickel transport system permease protein
MEIAAAHNIRDFTGIDGRIKTCVLLAAIVITGMLRHWDTVGVQIVATLIIFFAMRLSWRSLLNRLAIPLGFAWLVFLSVLFTHGQHVIGRINLYFAVLPIYSEGLAEGILIYLRITAMVMLATVLSFCTPMPEILATLRGLKMPGTLVDLAEMIYRYIFVLRATAVTMHNAQLSRCSSERSWVLKIQDVGTLSANVLIKAMDHSMQIYKAMVARGYDENAVIPPYFSYRIPQSDIFIGIVAAMGLVGLLIADFY